MTLTGRCVCWRFLRQHRTVPGGHLVHGAAAAAGVEHGRAAQEIALAITGTAAHRDDKRAAILAHASQVGPADVPGDDRFAAVYGREWYRRSGPPGVLDALAPALAQPVVQA